MLELRHLKTLHALRETDSLVEAAERLHLTQSALSHQFKELEERLGLQLFVRKTKPVRFTSAGLRLLQLADATLPLIRVSSYGPPAASSLPRATSSFFTVIISICLPSRYITCMAA